MKIIRFTLPVLVAIVLSSAVSAQEPEGPDIDKMITQEVSALEKLLDLDDVQVFFVDSILQHNVTNLMEEINELRKGGSEYQEAYVVVSDKWLDRTDNAFQEIFSEDQWKRYLKSTFGKEKVKRDKRMAKRASSKQ